jgi:hypothetical protein
LIISIHLFEFGKVAEISYLYSADFHRSFPWPFVVIARWRCENVANGGKAVH